MGVGVVVLVLLLVEPIGAVSESRLLCLDNSTLLLAFFRLDSGVLAVLPIPNSSGGGSSVRRPALGVPRSGDVNDPPPPPPPACPANLLSDLLALPLPPMLSDSVLESLDRPES